MDIRAYIQLSLLLIGAYTFGMALLHLLRPARAGQLSAYTDEPGITPLPPLVMLYNRLFAEREKHTEQRRLLTVRLTQGGIRSPYAATYILLFERLGRPLLLVLGLVPLCFALQGGGLGKVLLELLLCLACAIAALRGSEIYIANRRQHYQHRLNQSFPEVLDLLLVCIESGLGLDGALNRICKEMRSLHPEVIEELDRTRLELTLLNDRVIALQNLGERTDTNAFRSLVAALIQTERFGTSLVETLRVLAEDMRTIRLNVAEQKAARVPVLISIPLIIFIMPAFIMIIIAPPIVKTMSQGGISIPTALTGHK